MIKDKAAEAAKIDQERRAQEVKDRLAEEAAARAAAAAEETHEVIEQVDLTTLIAF